MNQCSIKYCFKKILAFGERIPKGQSIFLIEEEKSCSEETLSRQCNTNNPNGFATGAKSTKFSNPSTNRDYRSNPHLILRSLAEP